MSGLEHLTHVCLVAVSLVGIFVLIEHSRDPQDSATANREAQLVGKQLNLPGAAWQEKTVVLALSARCPFCVQSFSFYERLGQAVEQTHGKAAVIVVTRENPAALAHALTSAGVHTKGVLQVPFESIGVKATPTILMVDRNRVVKNALIGLLPDSKEAVVVEFLRP